jgi:hypothetical protein
MLTSCKAQNVNNNKGASQHGHSWQERMASYEALFLTASHRGHGQHGH